MGGEVGEKTRWGGISGRWDGKKERHCYISWGLLREKDGVK